MMKCECRLLVVQKPEVTMTDSLAPTEQFGVHLMIDAYGADPVQLADRGSLLRLLSELPGTLGMHIIAPPVVVEVGEKNRKDPGGFSGFVLIAESHISFHTFPRRQFLTLDLYTCQGGLDAESVLNSIKTFLQFSTADVQVVPRGSHYPSANLI